MEVINTAVGKMVEVLTERFLTSMGRRIGYVVHYKKNIENLDTKVQNLRGVRGRIEGKVDTARNNGHVIEIDVLDWLKDVNKKEEDLNRLLVDSENIKSCFDVRSRYRLGKEGKKLLSDVSGLIDHGSNFDTVGHRARLDKIWYTPTKNFEQFESRESVHKHIIKALENDMNYIIGIYGMGGSGKTRTAEEIAKQTQDEKLFDEVAKVVFSQIPNLKKIQEELAECLNMSFETKTEVGRKGQLRNRLKNGRKILVIIDDVWSDEVKLEEIGIPSSDNHNKGCKVLLTSRREDVCIKMGVQEKFSIGLLQEYEAWDLFKKTVGNFIESPHEIHSVAKQVCRECDCLPLAILVVGAALSNQKEKHVWDDALVQLSNCRGYNIEGVTEKLYSRIKWSYNYLSQPDIRSCFLYCSLFPEDAEIPIDDLVMYGVATKFLKDNSYTMKTARDRTFVLVDTLKKSHLLLEGKSRHFVKMHDVIRDVAISIASKEGFLVKTGVPTWPEKDEYESHKVISLRSKTICELPHELECSELRTLVLECDGDHKPQVPDSFFKGSEKLQVLELHFVRLPLSPLNLVNLRMLRLYGCEQVENDILQVQALFNHKVSKSFEQLTFLDIDQCHSLRNVFSPSMARNLRQLQDLTIRNCEKIEDIIAVEMVQGEEEITNDEIIVFPQLKKMNLVELPNLKGFWSCTCRSNKEAVEDDIPQVEALFNYKVKFPSLEELFCKGSKNNWKEIWNTTVPTDSFCKLIRLKVIDCDKLLSVAPSKLLGSFHNLEELEISYCPSLEEIFKVEGRSNIAEQGIVVARDKDIEEELETISELPSLVKMRITDCSKLKYVAFSTSKEKMQTFGMNNHCAGCIQKVKRRLRRIDAVYLNIDSEQGKVTMSGNVDTATATQIKKLIREGILKDNQNQKGGDSGSCG